MSALGRVRIGHKAPDFHCEAIVNGAIQEVSLSTYIQPVPSSPTNPPDPSSTTSSPWLLILFIPAAFSFVCPTEVLAFQTCLSEFQSRSCNIVFISVDTKHSLWHWQNVPRQYGGLGKVDIPLLSDANHRIAQDYGVLVEEEGVTLRGAFLIDGAGVVQQITLNNNTVGRSVLEALRLLEAFQAVAKHGVLCPVDWKPNDHAMETISTISGTLTESYEERLANLQREFGVTVTDLDEVYRGKDNERERVIGEEDEGGSLGPIREVTSEPIDATSVSQQDHQNPPSTTSLPTIESFHTPPSHSAPTSIPTTPVPPSRHPPISSTASSSTIPHLDQTYITTLFSHNSSPSSPVPAHTPGTGGSNTPSHGKGNVGVKHNTYSSRRGSHVVLDFAEVITPPHPPTQSLSPHPHSPLPTRTPITRPQTALRAQSYHGSGSGTPSTRPTSKSSGSTTAASSPSGAVTTRGQTRLQATFEAIKKMGVGLGSPRWKEEKGEGYFDGAGDGRE